MPRYRGAFWLFASLAGLVQAWQYRFWIEPDGLNYLDVASAYLRHDWSTAINSYWSPLYSWLLAATFYMIRPSPFWESTVLHALNFAIYLTALRCGEFLITELITEISKNEESCRLPAKALWLIGYCLLLFASLFMNSVYLDTPDLLLSAFVYAAGGLLVRTRSSRATSRTFVAFGVILAVSYLAKTVMFLVGFAFLIAAGRRRGTLLSFACFTAVSLPWVIVLSHSVKRLTYGDAGWANYVMYVASSGKPIHPLRVLFNPPEVREFDGPIRATYPPWYDVYWMAGLQPKFDLSAQLTALKTTVKQYTHILSGLKEFVLAFLLVFLAAPARFKPPWPIVFPSLAAFGLYAVVGHVESRLVGGFFVLFWIVLFSGLQVRSPSWVLYIALAVAAVTAFKVAKGALLARPPATHVEWLAATALRRQGLLPGCRVASFGHTTVAEYWARLGGFRIIADIPQSDMPAFWSAPASVRAEILARVSALGVQAVITPNAPPDTWPTIAGTPYSVYVFERKN